MQIRKLNMLRGLAALIVAVSHYSNRTDLLGRALGAGAGQIGVMLFFVLSGFLMSHLYLSRPFAPAGVRTFALARAGRVLPLYFAVVVCSWLFSLWGARGVLYDVGDARALASHLLLLSGTSILWTIPTEIHFYALFVLLWWFYARRGGYLFVGLALAFVGLFLAGFPQFQWRVAGLEVDLRLPHTLPFFLVGVAFGQLYRVWEAPPALRRHGFVLSLCLVPLLFPELFRTLTGRAPRTWGDSSVLLVVAAVFFALLFLVPDDNPLLANRAGDHLGDISYSIYLLHLPVLHLIGAAARKQPLPYLLVFVAAVLALATASYRLLEHPARRAIRGLDRGKARPA